ncbi:NAD(P)-binding protein [Fomes fomentarius]|nr:NAD(P)-binding protein [Fomes fomentarius]
MRGTSSYNSGWWPLLKEFFPPKPTFSVDQIPDLTGQVVIVTGGNVGIGYELVKVLLQHNAKVYLAARSKQKAEAAIASLRRETGKDPLFLALDLSSLTSVKNAAAEFRSKEQELHILFNNAGVMRPPEDQLSEEGFDMQWGTNVVGPWLFTEHLIPALLAGVQTSPDHHARAIFMSSSGAYLETLHYDTFKDGPARQKMSGHMLYCQSKFGNVVLARQFAKRYADKGIVAISLNPGNIRSELQRNASKLSQFVIDRFICYPTPYGALTPLFAGTMPEALNHNGEFLIPFARLGKCRAEAYDDAFGQRLWKWLQDETKQFSLRE